MRTVKTIILTAILLTALTLGTQAAGATTLGTVNYEYLNIRKKPTTASQIKAQARKNDIVSVSGKKYKGQYVEIGGKYYNAWYYVSYYDAKTKKKTKGYVLAKYITKYKPTKYVYTKKATEFYRETQEGMEVAMKIKKNKKLQVLWTKGMYIYVKMKTDTLDTFYGYVVGTYVKRK